MFTGLVAAMGEIVSCDDMGGGRKIVVKHHGFLKDSKYGDSVSNNGVCLTIVESTPELATFHAQVETIKKTTLGNWQPGNPVNLELPLRLNDLLGGHLVQGHVDGVVTLVNKQGHPDGSIVETFSVPEDLSRFIVDRGSVCLNGVSLTVASREADTFSVSLIPQTLNETSFGYIEIGDQLNIEIDCIARYVEQLMSERK